MLEGRFAMSLAATKRALFLAGAAGAAAGLLGTRKSMAATSLWDQVKATGVLRVAVISERPPYIVKAETGGYKGFSITMAQDLAKALEVTMEKSIKLEWVTTTWPTAVLDLQ